MKLYRAKQAPSSSKLIGWTFVKNSMILGAVKDSYADESQAYVLLYGERVGHDSASSLESMTFVRVHVDLYP